jgi:hypothetical protein
MLPRIAVALVLAAAGSAARSELPPNGSLRVAYRQLERGKLSATVFDSLLVCSEGVCRLTEIVLGPCVDGDGGQGWIPGAQTVTTTSGELVITKVGARDLEAEDRRVRESTVKYRWRFNTADMGPGLGRAFAGVTDFSGSVVENTPQRQGVRWTLVPLKGRSVRMPLNCDHVFLSGVSE